MLDRLKHLHPFQAPDAQRLAILFAIVYFAQGMWYLPNQTIGIVFKDHGFSAGQVQNFFFIATLPWLIKPVYGLISDFVPLFGMRRKSYLLLTSALAGAGGLTLGLMTDHHYWVLAGLFTAMGLGLAFTDVLVDALMVESGKPRGLTGAFQSVQWGAISVATVLVGVVGGYLAERRRIHAAFLLAACFPAISFLMTALFVKEARTEEAEREVFVETWQAIRQTLLERPVWIVAGFIFFWNFSPSFGASFLFYQTDALKFSQQFIGFLGSLGASTSIAGAFIYAPLSRRIALKRLIVLSIGAGATATLTYLAYRGPTSAIVISAVFGCVGMITQLAFLDLAAKACPRRVEATFFALLMSVFNGGVQCSEWVGAHLYDWLGYAPLVLISAGATALSWVLVPLVKIDRIEARARETAAETMA